MPILMPALWYPKPEGLFSIGGETRLRKVDCGALLKGEALAYRIAFPFGRIVEGTP